ncbi:MAG: UDP-N-acetylglucosamine 1-carboxyvinyltransferase, partial [Oscillospiraceae bacterium]|nr:UDP-N-acetylglucosamine 1-carboxyvinyltransferase [Oscillospiraceae bacterium]
GTFMAVAAATRSDILIKNVIPKHLEPITQKLVKIGVKVEQFDDAVRVIGGNDYVGTTVKTQPHPGFPTDMQPQMAAVLTCAKGASMVTESIFDNRFRYVDELRRMGANISVEGRVAVIEGVDSLKGAPVKATDLRAGAALIVAALGAEGVSEIYDIYHVERGYENMEEKLRLLGADIEKVDEPDPVASEKKARKAI